MLYLPLVVLFHHTTMFIRHNDLLIPGGREGGRERGRGTERERERVVRFMVGAYYIFTLLSACISPQEENQHLIAKCA